MVRVVPRVESNNARQSGLSNASLIAVTAFVCSSVHMNFCVFASEVVERASEMTIVFHKLAEIASKSKVALCFLEILEWSFPISDGFEFGFVYGDITIRNDMTKVFNTASSEVTFLEFAEPFGI